MLRSRRHSRPSRARACVEINQCVGRHDATIQHDFHTGAGFGASGREKGIIDFVAMLEDRERTVVFGFLVRLQRFLADDKKSTALRLAVSARDRPSILYYLLVLLAAEHADCVQLLRTSCRRAGRWSFLRWIER